MNCKNSITAKKVAVLLIVLLLIQTKIYAQNKTDRAFIKARTNVHALKELAEKHKSRNSNLLKSGVKKTIVVNNRTGYLSGFDKNGNPVYDFDDNIDAAKTSRVNLIWNGGSSNLNLDGSGVEIGHWEAEGLAYSEHQELTGRITHAEEVAASSHATHTAGTMIGAGVDANARGMASAATIVARRSNNDEEEIADFAAEGGILSNHSYSTGNPDGDTPMYGFYSDGAREWDEILYYAPYLTLCKSAGNERNDKVNTDDGGYDLVYTVTTSKNLITVGAIDDIAEYTGPESVVQSKFSDWGPTDDWRIKPDIVANGVGLYSADDAFETSYDTKNGTSMAAPVVTGTIALLQQHYHNKKGVYMKSATVKALLLATTDEAGEHDGPDFQNGWGLLNAERAAEVISNNGSTSKISELTLTEGSTYTTTIETDGTEPLTLTMVWTDPPGIPLPSGTDNPKLMLINDLDVRISDNSNVYEPWVITPNDDYDNFEVAASKGDNFRDNVERIDVKEIPAGTYTVTVNHKDNLKHAKQDFSLVISGISNETSVIKLPEGDRSILMYPVPAKNGSLNIALSGEYGSGNKNIRIYNLLGRLMNNVSYSEKQMKLDVSGLSSGSYIFEIEINNAVYRRLVIIEN